MELFSEIYSAYYNAAARILSEDKLTEKQMTEIIYKTAFSESSLTLLPNLKNNWMLLNNKNGIYSSVLRHKPVMPLTLLEKRWIKAILLDDKAGLFFDDDVIQLFLDKLGSVKPLFRKRDFFFFDRFSNGDDFKSPVYIKHFRMLHSAVISRQILFIDYRTSSNSYIKRCFLPLKLEFSPKNNKFRAYCVPFRNGSALSAMVINISGIQNIEKFVKYSKENTSKLLMPRRCSEPVHVTVSTERNGVERFMMEFAGYQKHTEFDYDKGLCSADIWYNSADETELLIRLLSFGPVLEITAPARFRQLAKERIDKQLSRYVNKQN